MHCTNFDLFFFFLFKHTRICEMNFEQEIYKMFSHTLKLFQNALSILSI